MPARAQARAARAASVRPRPALLALLALLSLLLAGCSGGDGGGGPDPSTTPSPTSAPPTLGDPAPPPQAFVVDLLPDFAFESCRGLSVQSPRPIEDVQALLPEGFTAAPFGVEGMGVLGLDLYVCGNLTTPTARVGAIAFGQVYTHVERPVERLLDAPEADVQEYAFRLLAGDDIGARLWPAAGYDTRNGSANVSISQPVGGLPLDPGLRLGNASIGDYLILATGSPATPLSFPGTFARYTALSDGSVLVWTGVYDRPAGTDGQGSFDVPAGDPFAGFEQANNVPGVAHLLESLAIVDQDLRRFF
jgi:hypothetical protein